MKNKRLEAIEAKRNPRFRGKPQGFGNDPSQWYTEGQGYPPPAFAGLLNQHPGTVQRPQFRVGQQADGVNAPRNIGLVDDARNWFKGLTGNKPTPVNHQAALEDAIDKYFPGNIGAKAALMSQAFHENNKFDPNKEEDKTANNRGRPKGLGIFQFTDQYDSETGKTKPGQRAAFEKYLKDTGLPNSADTQVGYYKKLSTTTDDAWAKKYHDIGAGHRQRNRLTFEAGDAFGISQHLTASVERPQNWRDKLVPRALSAQEWQKNYEPMQMMEPQTQLGYPTFNPEGVEYDYSAGTKPGADGHYGSRDPKTGQILKGRGHETFWKTIQGEQDAGYEIFQGEDGKYYSRPQTTKRTAHKPDKAYRQSQQPQYGNAGGGYTDAEMAGLVARSQAKGLLNSR